MSNGNRTSNECPVCGHRVLDPSDEDPDVCHTCMGAYKGSYDS